jgi:hypothetical protein
MPAAGGAKRNIRYRMWLPFQGVGIGANRGARLPLSEMAAMSPMAKTYRMFILST